MYKGIIVMVAFIQLLTGCTAQAMGTLSRGENASYSAANLKLTAVEKVEVTGPDDRAYFGTSTMDQYSLKPIINYVPFLGGAGGGNQYMSDTGHKIPDEVFVSWRELPPLGSKPYTGQLKGPYRVKVREKVPADVLRAIRKDGISLQMSFAFSDEGVLFNWQLINFNTPPARGIEVLRQGGDSFK